MDQDVRGAERLEAKAKNVGGEETDPRRPHIIVAEKNTGAGAGN